MTAHSSEPGRAGAGDKRDRILDAAERIFAEHGFFASRVAEIAREAGVADGTIYLYFKNKDDLLISLFESRMVQQTAVPDAALKLVFHLPWLVLAPAAWCLWRDRGPRLSRQRAGLLWLVCVANLLAFSRPHDWVHLIVLYVPTLLLLDWLGTRVVQRGVRAVRYVAVCVVGATGMVTAMLVWQLATANAFRLQTERGTIRVRAGDAAVMTDLLQALALAAPVGTPMLSLPYHPLVDFLANRPGVSRYYMVWPVEHDPNRDERIIESLEAAPTAPVTYALGQVPYFPPLETFAPRLTAYLADRYEVAESFGGGFGQMGFLLLRRAAPRAGRELGLVRPLPREVWPGGRVWRVDPGIDQDAALVGPLTPLAGDRVSTACGPPPTTWGQPTMPVIDCEMVVRHAQGESTVAKVEIDPFHRRADRRYTSLEAGLDAWQGQSVTVILRVRQLVAPHQVAVPVGWLPVWLAPSS